MKSTSTWGAYGLLARSTFTPRPGLLPRKEPVPFTQTRGYCDPAVEKFPHPKSRPGHTKIGSYAEVMGENTARCRRLGVSLEPIRAACYANRVGWERSPLSDDTVRAIRAAKGTEREIALELDVSVSQVGGVRRRESYAKVV